MVKKKRKKKKLNLLEFPDAEKIKMLREIKKNLQEKIIEAKLWKSLLESDSVIINGRLVFSETNQLSGLYLERKA
jgi:hypothetical protein